MQGRAQLQAASSPTASTTSHPVPPFEPAAVQAADAQCTTSQQRGSGQPCCMAAGHRSSTAARSSQHTRAITTLGRVAGSHLHTEQHNNIPHFPIPSQQQHHHRATTKYYRTGHIRQQQMYKHASAPQAQPRRHIPRQAHCSSHQHALGVLSFLSHVGVAAAAGDLLPEAHPAPEHLQRLACLLGHAWAAMIAQSH
jgi:hypothetical protein